MLPHRRRGKALSATCPRILDVMELSSAVTTVGTRRGQLLYHKDDLGLSANLQMKYRILCRRRWPEQHHLLHCAWLRQLRYRQNILLD